MSSHKDSQKRPAAAQSTYKAMADAKAKSDSTKIPMRKVMAGATRKTGKK